MDEEIPKKHGEKKLNTKKMNLMNKSDKMMKENGLKDKNSKNWDEKSMSDEDTRRSEANNWDNKTTSRKVDDTTGILYAKIQEMFQKKLLKERLLQFFLITYGIVSLISILLTLSLIDLKFDPPVDPPFGGMKLFRFILICVNVILIFLLAFTQVRIVSKWISFHSNSNSHQTITIMNFSIIRDINTLLLNILLTIGLSLILLFFLGYIHFTDGIHSDEIRPSLLFPNFIHILFLIVYIIVEGIQFRKWYKRRRSIMEYETMIEHEIPGFSNLVKEMDETPPNYMKTGKK